MTLSDMSWIKPSQQVTLLENEVHVWRATLEVSEHSFTALHRLLAVDEHERASRFYFERDRYRWTIARGVLRSLLSQYLNVDPGELQFINNHYGKPTLASPLASRHLQFNLSHSGDLALYAFACNRQVGIDIEHMCDDTEYLELARSHFSSAERTALLSLPLAQQREAFYLCWSRKEAYIKAKGRGLSLPLDQFDVSLVPGEPAALLASREDIQATERWSLRELAPGSRYAGALAVEGSGCKLCCWQWRGQ